MSRARWGLCAALLIAAGCYELRGGVRAPSDATSSDRPTVIDTQITGDRWEHESGPHDEADIDASEGEIDATVDSIEVDSDSPKDARTDAESNRDDGPLSCPSGQSRCGDGCVDTSSTTDHCGACDVACPARAGSASVCVGGVCRIVCDASRADCDDDPANGCEAVLSSAGSCGACGRVCVVPANGRATCAAGSCGIACNTGYHACGTSCADNTSVVSCGAQCSPCPARSNTTATCATDTCGFACNAGFADCDGDPDNGCEVDTRTSTSHCGMCGRRCGAGSYCSSSWCRPSVSWYRVFGGGSTGMGRPDNGYPPGPAGYSVASDAQGNIYVTGYFDGEINLGGGALTSAGGSDIFVASFSPSGTHRWSRRFGSSGPDRGYGVAIDGDGNLFVVGGFSASVSFGGTPLMAAGERIMDIFVASFTSGGSPRWAARYGNGGEDFGLGVTTDNVGNLYVTGAIGSRVDFGGSSVGGGGAEVFVASITGMGAVRWARGAESSNTSMSVRVASDGHDGIAIVGYTEGSIDFGAGPLSSPDRDAFIASYGYSGALRWVRRFASSGTDAFHGVAFDATGNVIVSGSITGDVDLGGGTLPRRGSTDIVVASFNAVGSHRWSHRFGSEGEDRAYGLVVDGSGNAYISGSIGGGVDVGGGVLSTAGGLDAVVFSLGPAGEHRWSRRFGGRGNDEGIAIAVNRVGALSLTGQLSDSVDLDGPTPAIADGADAFLMQLDPGSP